MGHAVNGFGGMDMDSSPRNRDGAKYFKVINGQILSDQDLKNGSLQNVKGNVISHAFSTADAINPGEEAQDNLIIIGAYSITDYIVYFTTSEGNVTPEEGVPNQGQIWVAQYDSEGVMIGEPELKYNGFLDFNSDYPILATGRYIDDNNIKVYFVDGYHSLRFINILEDTTENDLDDFEIIGRFSPGEIEAIGQSGGSYKAGSVQYAYQLINFNGVETVFSSSTMPYHISSDSSNSQTGDAYKGTLSQSTSEENTGQGFMINISDLDSSYTYIRLVALFYESFNSTPEVRIIYEGELNGAGLSFFDDGLVNKGVISFTAFQSVGLFELTSSLITDSSTRLAVADATERIITLDYDSRVYRFDGVNGTSKIKLADDSSFIEIASNGSWTETGGSGRTGTGWDIPEEYDCVNFDPDVYKYNINGDIGGTGKNVSYKTKYKSIAIEEDGGEDDTSGHIPIGDDGKFTSYANEDVSAKYRGYRRKETYRFGLIGYDDKLSRSYVNWMADIKMPSQVEGETIASSYDGTTYAKVLYLEFTVNNLPSHIETYQIVREKRTRNDRTIIGSGLLEVSDVDRMAYYQSKTDGDNPTFPYEGSDVLDTASSGSENRGADVSSLVIQNTSSSSKPSFRFIFPELLYNNIPSYNDAEVNISGVYRFWRGLQGGADRELLYKALYVTPFNQEYSGDVFKVKKLSGSMTDTTVHNGTYKNYFTSLYDNGADGVRYFYGRGSDALHITYENKYDAPTYDAASTATNDIIEEIMDLHTVSSWEFRRSVLYADMVVSRLGQYGGNSYAIRNGRRYIQASEIISKINTSCDVFGGDTFIGMFEYLRVSAGANDNQMRFDNLIDGDCDASQTAIQVSRFPVESSINIDARAHQNYGSMETDEGTNMKRLVQPKAGYHHIEDDGPMGSLTQNTGFYSYNSAYSKENDAKIFFSKGLYTDQLTLDKPNTIFVSDAANGLSISDDWLNFKPENNVTVNGKYGKLSSINGIRDKIVFIQEDGVGYLNISPDSIISTTEEELVLGSGKVVSKALYVAERNGSKYTGSATLGKNGIYFIDEKRNAIFVVNGEAVNLSLMKGVTSYLKQIIDASLVNGEVTDIYNVQSYTNDNKVYFKVMTNNNYHSPIIVYNEELGEFEMLLNKNIQHLPISHKNKLYETSNISKNEVWLDGVGVYGKYFGVDNDMALEFIVNEGALIKAFDGLEFNATPYANKLKSITIMEGGRSLSGFHTEDPKIRFKFKKFRVHLPKKQIANSKISERYINNYAHIRLVFDNSGDEEINIFDIITHFRTMGLGNF